MCRYCFVQLKYDISNIERGEGPKSLRGFIDGQRNGETEWCDWNICLLYTSPSPRDVEESRMPSSA